MLFEQVSNLLDLPVGLLMALCTVESNQRNVINWHDGNSPSYGVCQIKYITAKHVDKAAVATDLMKPERNIELAGRYLKQQHKRYGSWEAAIAAYNAGRAQKFKDGRWINQTYVNKVMKKWKNNQRLSPCALSLMSSY